MIDFAQQIAEPREPRLIVLRRAPISAPPTPGDLDVTAKSAKGWARKLAPPWDLVLAHKQGRVDAAEFARKYIECIDPFPPRSRFPFVELVDFGWKAGREITFKCYCPNRQFCHTHVLIDWLAGTVHPQWFADGRQWKAEY